MEDNIGFSEIVDRLIDEPDALRNVLLEIDTARAAAGRFFCSASARC